MTMRCKEYIFLLSSGQLAEAPLGVRWAGARHRLVCSHCRAFTANDRVLSEVLAKHPAAWRGPASAPTPDQDGADAGSE